MAGVVRIDALWKQAFATALAPARKSGSAALGSHTCAKTVLAFTRSLRWLKSAFHNRDLARIRSGSAYTRGRASIVNASCHQIADAATHQMPLLFSIARALIYKVAKSRDFWNNDSQRNGGKRKCRDRAGD